MKTKIVVIDVPPRAGVLIDNAHADHFPKVICEINMDARHVFDLTSATRLVNDIPARSIQNLNPGLRLGTGANSVAGPRMSNLEGRGG